MWVTQADLRLHELVNRPTHAAVVSNSVGQLMTVLDTGEVAADRA